MKGFTTKDPAAKDETRVFEKTAVFHIGDLRREEGNVGFQMDDDTRELPLISGRFAGREWKAEELRQEQEERASGHVPMFSKLRFRWGAAMLAGAALCFTLLTVALTGQAALTELNDQAVTVTAEISALREENGRLRTESAQLLDMAEAERYATETLGMQHIRQEQVTYLAERGEDRATVLAVRRGQGFTHFCADVVDTLGAYLHG